MNCELSVLEAEGALTVDPRCLLDQIQFAIESRSLRHKLDDHRHRRSGRIRQGHARQRSRRALRLCGTSTTGLLYRAVAKTVLDSRRAGDDQAAAIAAARRSIRAVSSEAALKTPAIGDAARRGFGNLRRCGRR